MKSLITNCNSNDQLLQLVSIQLLQKAYFRQLMFEGANYFSIYSFLLVLVAVQFLSGKFPHLAAKLADRKASTQGSSSWSSAANATSYLSQYMTDSQLPVHDTAAEYWQQKLVAKPQVAAVPLVAQDVIFGPASQAFVGSLFQFVVC